MALNKEQILTLTCLKEVGFSGFGTQKIMILGTYMADNDLTVETYEDLCDIIKKQKGAVFQKVTLNDLSDANKIARKIIDESERHDIGYVGFYDEDFPEALRSTINEEGKQEPPLILWYRGDLSITKMPGLAVIGTRKRASNSM